MRCTVVAKLTINVPEDLRRRAKLKALQRGETISDVVRAALENYVSTPESDEDTRIAADPWENDSILDIIGMVRGGPADMSSDKHAYLAEATG